MKSLLRKKRKKLMEAKSMYEYLKYAFGEVILVVIGILIALSINNWNINRIKTNKLESIATQVVNDLESDTVRINSILDVYKPLEETYLKVLGDSLSIDELKECEYCGSLVSVIIPFTPNEAGYNLLKNLDRELNSEKDSLLMLTKQFYGQARPMMELISKSIEEDTKSNLNEWKIAQDWFAGWILGEDDPRFYEYMKTQDYRNRVANFYLLQYQNHIPLLKAYKVQAGELAQKWREELGMELDKK